MDFAPSFQSEELNTQGALPIPESLYETISRFGSEHKEVAAVYLFGSRATGKYRSGSDFDIAVMVRGSIDGMKRVQLETSLSNMLRRDVDVVIFGNATPLLQHQILTYGQLIFERDPGERIRQEVIARREYLDGLDLYRVIEG